MGFIFQFFFGYKEVILALCLITTNLCILIKILLGIVVGLVSLVVTGMFVL